MGPVEQQPKEVTQTSPSSEVVPVVIQKSKTKLIIGIVTASVLTLSMVAGVVAFVVYNNPDNVVADAFSKAISAKSAQVSGTLSAKSEASTVDITTSYVTNEASQAAGNISAKITSSDKEYTVKAQFASTKDAAYFKPEGVRTLLLDFLTGTYGADVATQAVDTYYGGLLKKIDGKWVMITAKDLQSSGYDENSIESACIEQASTTFQNDASIRNEAINIYRQYPLFTVESKGSDADGARYGLIPVSEDKAAVFLRAIVNTKLFRMLDDCVEQDLEKALLKQADNPSSDSAKSNTEGSIDIWVDSWTHNLNKLSIRVKSDEQDIAVDLKMKLNTNPSVSLPKAETTFSDIKNEIRNIQGQLFPESDTGARPILRSDNSY